MTDSKKYTKILSSILKMAQEYIAGNNGENYIKRNLTAEQTSYAKTLIDNAEMQKSLIAVVMTSLLKKIKNPSQDIRLHRNEFEGGYSGRTLDTNVVTPWLKQHFRRFATRFQQKLSGENKKQRR
jgi:hypothetical protein